MADPALYIRKKTWVGKGAANDSTDDQKCYYNVKDRSYSFINRFGVDTGNAVAAATIKKVDVKILTQVIRGGDAQVVPLREQPIFCWKKEGENWQPTALLHTDDSGIIRYVDIDYRNNFKKQLYDLFVKRDIVKGVRIRNTTLFSKTGYIANLPLFYKYLRPCKFDPGAEYFFAIIPVEEMLTYQKSLLKEGIVKAGGDALPEKLMELVKNPPDPKWCEGAFNNIATEEDYKNNKIDFGDAAGTLCTIPPSGSIIVPYNFTCFISELVNRVSFMEKEAKKLHSFISHEEKVSSTFDSLINFLIMNRGHIEQDNRMRDWQKKIQNHIYFLSHFKNNVEQSYASLCTETEKQRATAFYHEVCDRNGGCLVNILLNPSFTGQLRRAEINGLDSIPCLDWFKENVPAKIICETIAAIGIHTSEIFQHLFYKGFLLPFFLELAFRLEENDLTFLSEQVSASELKKSMPFLSNDDIQSYAAKIKSFLNRKSLTVEETCEIRKKLEIFGNNDSASILSSFFESGQINIAPFFHLVFETFETLVDHYNDTDSKLLLAMVLLRSNFAALKHITEIKISSGDFKAERKSPGEKRYQIRYNELFVKLSSSALDVGSRISEDACLKSYIGLLSSSLGMIDSLVVVQKYGQKKDLTWEDKRDLTLAAISLTSNSISFINFFSKVFKEDITNGFLAPASFVFAAMKGKDSIRNAIHEKDYPAVALHSYSMASSGIKSAEAMFKMMHRLKVIHVRNKLGTQAAKMVFKKGFMFSRFFTVASKFTGPVGLAIAMYEVIQLCESYSQQKRRQNNPVWDQTCKFAEVINALIAAEPRYHSFSVPKLDGESIKGFASIYGGEEPVDWKTYFEGIVKLGSKSPAPFFDCEKFLVPFDQESNRSKMYETRGVSFYELQKKDAIALYHNGDIPVETIAEMVGMGKNKLQNIISVDEREKQAELEEHWRSHTQKAYTEQEHYDALNRFTDS